MPSCGGTFLVAVESGYTHGNAEKRQWYRDTTHLRHAGNQGQGNARNNPRAVACLKGTSNQPPPQRPAPTGWRYLPPSGKQTRVLVGDRLRRANQRAALAGLANTPNATGLFRGTGGAIAGPE